MAVSKAVPPPRAHRNLPFGLELSRPSCPFRHDSKVGHRVALLAGCALTLLFLAATFKPVVEQDGVNYYVYLHSIVVDHDLDFSDEYQAAEAAHIAVTDVLVGTRLPTGLLANFQPIGSAVLALPFYLV